MSALRVARMLVVGLLVVGPGSPALAQSPIDPYFEFMIGRRLESQGDTKGALAALERAAAASPTAGEIKAEIAAYYMRQNQPEAAEKAARAALAIDDSSIEAHRILGLLLGGSAERMKESVTHLERVVATPTGATDVSVQFTLGRLYLLTGANDRAIDLLQRIVEDSPYLVQARVTLVQAYTAAGRPDDAIRTLEPAAAGDPRLSATLAQLYERVGRRREAADAYGKAAGLNPTNRDAQVRYATALMATGTRVEARAALGVIAPLIERSSKDTGALYLQAQAYRRTGDVFAAERSARAILAVDPNSVSGAYALAQVYGQSRRYKDVISQLEPFVSSATSRGENVSSLLTYLSAAYQSLGQHDRAIEALARAKAAEPNEPSIDVYLVQANAAARRFTQAATLAEEAQKKYPDEIRFTYLQARSLFQSGAQPRALTMLEGTLKAHPGDVDAYLNLAGMYGQASRLDDGLRLLDQAEKRFPDDISVLFRRAAVLAEAKREADAEQAFKRVLARQPKNGEALNYLGYMLADRTTRLDEAIGLITQALESDDDNPSYLDSLGWAYFKKGDLAQAEKNLMRAADALPLNSVVQDHYGDLLAKVGKVKEATLAWTKALGGDGDEIDRPAIEKKIRDARGKSK